MTPSVLICNTVTMVTKEDLSSPSQDRWENPGHLNLQMLQGAFVCFGVADLLEEG